MVTWAADRRGDDVGTAAVTAFVGARRPGSSSRRRHLCHGAVM
ncbi:hypothetical protein GZL_04231 [Streptomyces sp. 769]|nr:hypothetical protein GZL_04231 [Streptomyces sp. 769]